MPRGLISDEKGIDKFGKEGEKRLQFLGLRTQILEKTRGTFFLFFYDSVVFYEYSPSLERV